MWAAINGGFYGHPLSDDPIFPNARARVHNYQILSNLLYQGPIWMTPSPSYQLKGGYVSNKKEGRMTPSPSCQITTAAII